MRNPRIFMVVFGVLAFGAAAVRRIPTGGVADKKVESPQIVVDEPDRRVVTDGTEPSTRVQYVLQNRGLAALEIRGVNACCGCTVLDLQKKRIAPHDEATLTLRVSSLRSGYHRYTARVYSNDPKKPQVDLTIVASGEGKPPYLGPVQQSTLSVRGAAAELGIAKTKFEAIEPERANNWVVAARTKLHGVAARIKHLETRAYRFEPGACAREYELEVAMTAECEFGARTGVVEVMSTDGRLFELPVAVERTRPVVLSPDRLAVRFDSDGARTTKEIVLSGSVPFSVKGVTPHAPWIECAKSADSRKDGRQSLSVTIDAPRTVGVVESKLELEVIAGATYRIELPVLAYRSKPESTKK